MIQATPPQMADADILKVSQPPAWPGDCLGSWGSRSRGIMTWEPGSEAVGGHEETGSFPSKERPTNAVILGTNAGSPGFKSLLLEAYPADRAWEMCSYHSGDTPGMAISQALGESYWLICLSWRPLSQPQCPAGSAGTPNCPSCLPLHYVGPGALIIILAHKMKGHSKDSQNIRVQPVAKGGFPAAYTLLVRLQEEKGMHQSHMVSG